MRGWLDCEFNGFGGDLISMGIVTEDGREWYETVGCADPIPWVTQNVLPHLKKKPVTLPELQVGLAEFLRRYEKVEIIADWPEDIVHLARALLLGNGRCLKVPVLTMVLKLDLPPVSKVSTTPHNALEDARALMRIDQHISARAAQMPAHKQPCAMPTAKDK